MSLRKRIRAIGAAIALSSALALSCLAGLASAEVVMLRDGTLLDAKVIEVDSNGALLEYVQKTGTQTGTPAPPTDKSGAKTGTEADKPDPTKTPEATKGVVPDAEGTTVRAKFSKEALDPYSHYILLRNRLKANDAASHLELAKFCLDAGLYDFARGHAEAALKLDPSVEDQAKYFLDAAEKGMTRTLLDEAKDLAARGEWRQATEDLATLIAHYPDSAAADTARTLMDTFETARADAGRKDYEKRRADLGAEREKALEQLLEPVRANYRRGLELTQKGLRSTGSEGSALELFKQAAAAYRAALNELERSAKSPDVDSTLQGEISALDREIRSRAVDAYLNMSSLYAVRTSYQQALEAINEALSIDPNDPSALAARDRLEIAAAESSGGYFRGGRGGAGERIRNRIGNRRGNKGN